MEDKEIRKALMAVRFLNGFLKGVTHEFKADDFISMMSDFGIVLENHVKNKLFEQWKEKELNEKEK